MAGNLAEVGILVVEDILADNPAAEAGILADNPVVDHILVADTLVVHIPVDRTLVVVGRIPVVVHTLDFVEVAEVYLYDNILI